MCMSKYLDIIVRNKLSEKGYEYILRIISKNPNTSRLSLHKIANNEFIDSRYIDVAQKRLLKYNSM